ncbi:hypothetical protein FRB95_007532 [Tulasnella sp. JGI-2019a]|nr:hypothetical protein FRB95_007532 [Tulasnella sp. JGI-2019a]
MSNVDYTLLTWPAFPTSRYIGKQEIGDCGTQRITTARRSSYIFGASISGPSNPIRRQVETSKHTPSLPAYLISDKTLDCGAKNANSYFLFSWIATRKQRSTGGAFDGFLSAFSLRRKFKNNGDKSGKKKVINLDDQSQVAPARQMGPPPTIVITHPTIRRPGRVGQEGGEAVPGLSEQPQTLDQASSPPRIADADKILPPIPPPSDVGHGVPNGKELPAPPDPSTSQHNAPSASAYSPDGFSSYITPAYYAIMSDHQGQNALIPSSPNQTADQAGTVEPSSSSQPPQPSTTGSPKHAEEDRGQQHHVDESQAQAEMPSSSLVTGSDIRAEQSHEDSKAVTPIASGSRPESSSSTISYSPYIHPSSSPPDQNQTQTASPVSYVNQLPAPVAGTTSSAHQVTGVRETELRGNGNGGHKETSISMSTTTSKYICTTTATVTLRILIKLADADDADDIYFSSRS